MKAGKATLVNCLLTTKLGLQVDNWSILDLSKNYNYCLRIRIIEVANVLRKMRLENLQDEAVSPTVVWKCLGIEELTS